jgi:hypothetical protein
MAKVVNAPPIAKNFIKTLRKFGYTMESAVSDIIDNSISAKAKTIRITYLPQSDWLSIIDDGKGMSKDELIIAMTPGSSDPDLEREDGDLGRFGSGLKTASWSQAKKLIVVTKDKKSIYAASWDLDEIEKTNTWDLSLLSESEINSICKTYFIDIPKKGTAVIWDKIDSIQGSTKQEMDGDQSEKLSKIIDHVALTYHRFLEAAGSPLKIEINNQRLKPRDPFLKKHPRTHESQPDMIGQIKFQVFTIPNPSDLVKEDLQELELNDGLIKNQGFYIYRHKRLIQYGGWFGLDRFKELSKLTRIMVDVPISLDSEWVTDVKKSSMRPPPIVRKELRNIILRLQSNSKRNIQYKGTKSIKSTKTWEVVTKEKLNFYQLSKENTKLKKLAKELDQSKLKILNSYLKDIETDIPWEAIYSDFASDNIFIFKEDE